MALYDRKKIKGKDGYGYEMSHKANAAGAAMLEV